MRHTAAGGVALWISVCHIVMRSILEVVRSTHQIMAAAQRRKQFSARVR
jgi:hypothetical protein